MAYSYVFYAGDGTTKNYPFNFSYLSRDHVKVIVDGSPVSFSFQSANIITLASAAPVGTTIQIYRDTPKDQPPVIFTDGSILLERDLNLESLFNLFVSQEAIDYVSRSIVLDTQGRFTALNRRIVNVADPLEPQDVVTKNWAETTTSTFTGQAVQSATNAATSANAAATSATQAQSSATQAQSSATQAQSSATQALDSKGFAEAAATAAGISATNAASSASTATTKASDAAASANAAATSATNASSSASAASTSATDAANSASNAITSATAAKNALKSFVERYYGGYASDPATDPNGNAPTIGDMYFNTTHSVLKVYSATGWINGTSSVNGTSGRFRYVAMAGQRIFSGSDTNSVILVYDPGFIDVYLNGIRLGPTEYTATTGTSVVLAVGAPAGAELNIVAYGTFTLQNNDCFWENSQVVTANYTITTGKNAMSAGPISVANGVTVTVPNGSVWTVV